jgi:hypothetical protein
LGKAEELETTLFVQPVKQAFSCSASGGFRVRQAVAPEGWRTRRARRTACRSRRCAPTSGNRRKAIDRAGGFRGRAQALFEATSRTLRTSREIKPRHFFKPHQQQPKQSKVMNSLENMVSRYRKLQETIEELSDCLKPIKCEAKQLEDEIFAALSRDKSLYNVGVYKKFAEGIIGRNLVRVDFGAKVQRIKGRDDDQTWLAALKNDRYFKRYVKSVYALDKAQIQIDMANNETNNAELNSMGVKLETSYGVKVSRVRKDAEIAALIDEARTLAEAEERED